MKFSEVIGQDKLKKQLIHGVTVGRIPHAQLFLGKVGNGSLPLALAYAQYVSCTNRQLEDSCGICSSCSKYKSLVHPDLHFSFPFPSKAEVASEYLKEWRSALLSNPYLSYDEWMAMIEADNKQGNIPVKECRAIIRSLSLKPFESEYKVLLMWLPEYLGQEGNILLKIIEEPPQNTLFLLVGANADKIINTIISRTQPVRVPPIVLGELSKALVARYDIGEANANRIAQMSQGDFRIAVSLIQETENPYFDQWRNWMGLCYTRKISDAVKWADEMAAIGRESLKSFLLYGLEILRGVLVIGFDSSVSSWVGQERDFIEKFNNLQIPVPQLEKIVLEIESAISNIERNGNAKMILTDLSFKVARNFKK